MGQFKLSSPKKSCHLKDVEELRSGKQPRFGVGVWRSTSCNHTLGSIRTYPVPRHHEIAGHDFVDFFQGEGGLKNIY